jgi:hypothetical protein
MYKAQFNQAVLFNIPPYRKACSDFNNFFTDEVLNVLMNGIVVFVKKILTPTILQSTDILHKQFTAFAVGTDLTVIFCY